MNGVTRGGCSKPFNKFDRQSSNKSRGSPRGAYIMDKALLPRMKQYLSQFRKGYTPDIEEMTSHLQSRYSDYSRKKRNSFRFSVQKAFKVLNDQDNEEKHLQRLEEKFLQEKSKDFSFIPLVDDRRKENVSVEDKEGSDTSDSELSLLEEPLIETQGSNLMNQSMQSMYRLSTSRPSSEAEDNNQTENDPTGNISTPIVVIDTNLPSSTPQAIKSSSVPSTMEESTSNQQPGDKPIDISRDQDSSVINKPNTPNSQNKRKTDISDKEEVSSRPSKKRRRSRAENSNNENEINEDKPKGFTPTQSSVKFSDVGGCEETIEQVCKMLIHMCHPEVFSTLGITPPRGFLLHGPPGCGKTLLAHAIAGELELPFLKLAATEIVSGVSGESEEKVRELFNSAVTQAPCVMFIDEIDAITPKRETASKDMERRIVSQLLTCMDDLNNNSTAQVLVIGATNRPDSLDPALRRAGRFDREISMGIPDEKARERVLKVLCKQLKLSDEFSFAMLARLTPGFVGADLMALTREASMIAVNRVFKSLQNHPALEATEGTRREIQGSDDKMKEDENKTETNQEKTERSEAVNINVMQWLKDQPPLTDEQLSSLSITFDDFKEALTVVQPSAKREGFATIPDVTWNDIGALKDVREELSMAILAPVQHPDEFASLGLSHPPGILLAGPPGCGKTLLAKAIANESGINFISVKGPELLNMYVGESERAVRQVFQRARNSSPCVIFFDELDALCPRRSGSSESGVSVRVVNQLLTEMDGLEARKQVFIMAATNRPDIIDPAVMRPGRLDKVLYVGLPSSEDRKDILMTITKGGTKPVLLPEVDIEKIGFSERCNGYSGADLAALVREASMAALRECISISSLHDKQTNGPATRVDLDGIGVGNRHFDIAFDKVKPSVSNKDHVAYHQIKTSAAKL
ncbi:nuclear valosin-containing protein-like [Actinia tenebrosa]|uniref:Nuclear valosin-containing protein-like n=1 Tax=Actinia tenebrosa TaxID=6105 RepID=A0A6P8IFD6_ACTTE|nr:nuclear valosin-containing protein-like [Actinia tenebrosa]